MKIGLDFDGVITDCGKLKSEGAKRIYGVDIPPGRFKKELVIDAGILTKEQYRKIQKYIYGTNEFGLLMEAVDGVLDYLPKLQKDGHDIKIITSREEMDGEIAIKWMEQRGLSVPITFLGYNISKIDSCRGLDVYIDDDLNKLEPLVEIVPYRFLFSWGYNEDIMVNPLIAKRVKSWKEFYNEIKKISNFFE